MFPQLSVAEIPFLPSAAHQFDQTSLLTAPAISMTFKHFPSLAAVVIASFFHFRPSTAWAVLVCAPRWYCSPTIPLDESPPAANPCDGAHPSPVRQQQSWLHSWLGDVLSALFRWSSHSPSLRLEGKAMRIPEATSMPSASNVIPCFGNPEQ